jgi:murein DD-endopeptidase MepM/ murein hydrolase activator NlpD
MLKLLSAAAGASLLALLAGCAQPSPNPPARRLADVPLVSDTVNLSGVVPRNATLASLLRDQQMRQDVIPGIIAMAGEVFDPRRLRADQPFRLVRTVDGLLRQFEYEIDEDRFLRIAAPTVMEPDRLKAELVAYQKERALVSLRGEINRSATSLFAAMDDAGERPDLSIELADIFGGEIDFNTELQPGDTFSLAFEKVYREGRFSAYGPVRAAEFENDGRVLKAVRFAVPGGKPGYYDEHGRSLKRFFLASPLKFTAPVTSRFSKARFHPILRIYRPHLGVDYAAPIGSPVVAVAAGTVVSAGWSGQAGRLVRLRHASGYETYYMHLSSIAVRAGAHVSQGQLIGRVGSSGLSSGPHLDYRIRKDGRAMNPQLVHRSLPPGEPVPAAHMAQFLAERDRALARLVPKAQAGAGASGGPTAAQ